MEQERTSITTVAEPARDHAWVPEAFDHVELYVENIRQAAHFYRTAFGFAPAGWAGLETGLRDHASWLMRQQQIQLRLTSGLQPDHRAASYVRRHGDGVGNVAFRVKNAEATFQHAVTHGATALQDPAWTESARGRERTAVIGAFGDTTHSFVEYEGEVAALAPGYEAIAKPAPVASTGLTHLDHIAVGVPAGELDAIVSFYEQALGFHPCFSDHVTTEYSAMKSRVVENESGTIKITILEPASGRRTSQIQEYIAYHGGAGTQHLAFATDDIFATVAALRANGVDFLRTPDAYYDALPGRVGTLGDLATLHELGILVDRDSSGLLFQLFTKPVQSRPTLFIEVIHRRGARGFGGGNVRALFEAIEHDQARRGNL
jgi:4-hydroxyphenylpyruvate dioxygenase